MKDELSAVLVFCLLSIWLNVGARAQEKGADGKKNEDAGAPATNAASEDKQECGNKRSHSMRGH